MSDYYSSEFLCTYISRHDNIIMYVVHKSFHLHNTILLAAALFSGLYHPIVLMQCKWNITDLVGQV